MAKSVLHAILSGALGLVVFLVILFILNILTAIIPDYSFLLIVQFLNANLYLIILMSLFTFFAEVFHALEFPLNLPAPIFSAVGAMFIITFILKIFALLNPLTGGAISIDLGYLAIFIYVIVFIIVFVAGYILIFAKLSGQGHGSVHEHHQQKRPARRR
jgi:hypothetical protein